MDSFQDLLKKRTAPAKTDAAPAPEKGMGRLLYLLCNYFWSLVAINLLFVLCCIPVVTIPAALCALNRYMIKMVRDGFGVTTGDFFREFKAELFKSLPVGLLVLFFLAYGSYLMSISREMAGGMWLSVIAVMFFFFAVMTGSYAFLLLAMLDLRIRDILKNTVILIFIEWKRTFLVMLAECVMIALPLLFFPVSIFVLAVIWFALNQLAVCCILNEAVQKRIIEPYEKTEVTK